MSYISVSYTYLWNRGIMHLWFLIALIESLFIIAVISKKRNLFTYKYSGIVCVLISILGVYANHYFSAMPMLKPILLAMPTIILGGHYGEVKYI